MTSSINVHPINAIRYGTEMIVSMDQIIDKWYQLVQEVEAEELWESTKVALQEFESHRKLLFGRNGHVDKDNIVQLTDSVLDLHFFRFVSEQDEQARTELESHLIKLNEHYKSVKHMLQQYNDQANG